MIVKYKEYQGQLLNYELVNNEKCYCEINLGKNCTIKVFCSENEIKIPNVFGNSANLDK